MTLKEIRKKKNFTQQGIAKALGLKISTYAMYELGKRDVDVGTAYSIANILSVGVNEIFDIKKFVAKQAKKQR